MNSKTSSDDKSKKGKDDDPALLKLARLIDPPSRETSDEELIDPGAHTPDSPPPVKNESDKLPSGSKK